MAKQASNDRPLEQHDADLHGVRPKSQTLLCNIHRSVLPVLTWINRATGRIGKSIDVWQHASSARTLSELKERLMERKPIMHAVMFAGLVMLAALSGVARADEVPRESTDGRRWKQCEMPASAEPMPTCLHGVR
jgi:hypothetical protein